MEPEDITAQQENTQEESSTIHDAKFTQDLNAANQSRVEVTLLGGARNNLTCLHDTAAGQSNKDVFKTECKVDAAKDMTTFNGNFRHIDPNQTQTNQTQTDTDKDQPDTVKEVNLTSKEQITPTCVSEKESEVQNHAIDGQNLIISEYLVVNECKQLKETSKESPAVNHPYEDFSNPALSEQAMPSSTMTACPSHLGKELEFSETDDISEELLKSAPDNHKQMSPITISESVTSLDSTPINQTQTLLTTTSDTETTVVCSPIIEKETPTFPDASNPTPLAVTTPTDSLTTSPAQLLPQAAHLRGYLQKRGGALKAWKQRWFVFADEADVLMYFRTPRDVTALGQVRLSHASFTCDGAEPGVFYLNTPERVVTLKAKSEQHKFYWLQQLQLRRWIRNEVTGNTTAEDTAGPELFPQLQFAEQVNTEEAASQPLFLQLSLKHPLIEFQNSVKSRKMRSSTEVRQSVFHVPTPSPTTPTTPSTNQSTRLAAAIENASAGPSNDLEESSASVNHDMPQTGKEANQERDGVVTQNSYKDLTSTNTSSSSALFRTMPMLSQALPTVHHAMPTVGPPVTLRKRNHSFLRRISWSERSLLQQELQDQKDLVGVLQQALELCQSERNSLISENPELFGITEEQELRNRLEHTQVKLQNLQRCLEQRDQTIRDLHKQVRELSERSRVKQLVIEKISSCNSRWMEQSSDVDQQSIQSLLQHNHNLQDDLKAFRNQNHFLNSEIHHLNELWRTSAEGQRVLMNKASVQRAQYLRLLRQLQEVSVRAGPESEALRRILQDAVSQEQSPGLGLIQSNREWDQYGFPLVPDLEIDDIKMLSKIQAPDLRAQQNQDAMERSVVSRWEQYMSSCCGELNVCPELKNLIRCGVPPHLRPQVWNWIVRTRTQRDQDPLQYHQVCEQIRSSPQSGSIPWSRQIDLDLPRTLCTNHNFRSSTSPALQQLRRILLAFSWENSAIGYCQGLNRIAGLLLLVLGSEEDTFWALKAVVENIMPPDYYTPSLVGSQADQLVLKDFLCEKLPRLWSHLNGMGVDVSSSTFAWFLVMFVEVLPCHILLPLWDTFLYEGSKVLFRFSVAMFKLKEPEILQLSTPLELHQYFRVLPKTVLDYRRLSAVAFGELNPFSRRTIRSRRALHMERLQRELCELQRQQSLFLSQRSIRKSSEEEEAPGKGSGEIPGPGDPREASGEAPDEAPLEAPVETPLELPGEAPVEAPGPGQASEEAQGEDPGPEEVPVEAPPESPGEAPVEAPGPGQASEEAQGEDPGPVEAIGESPLEAEESLDHTIDEEEANVSCA